MRFHGFSDGTRMVGKKFFFDFVWKCLIFSQTFRHPLSNW